MPKAVAVQAVFMVGVIAIFILFLVGILSGWTGSTKIATEKVACIQKSTDYCRDLVKDKNPQWEDIENCQKPSEGECCSIHNICG